MSKCIGRGQIANGAVALWLHISQDPIRLEAGLTNLYVYVHDTNAWMDVLGLFQQIPLAKLGEDLFVGTYNQVRGGNMKTGLNSSHTPHHTVQNAISPTTHGRGITINFRKDLHELTRTYKVPIDKSILSLRDHLAADITDLNRILLDAGYDPQVINRQLSELIRQNKELGGLDKPAPHLPKVDSHSHAYDQRRRNQVLEKSSAYA